MARPGHRNSQPVGAEKLPKRRRQRDGGRQAPPKARTTADSRSGGKLGQPFLVIRRLRVINQYDFDRSRGIGAALA